MGRAILNLAGKRFGRLVALSALITRDKSGGIIWQCRCDCGKTTTAVSGALRAGDKQSCGCLLVDTGRNNGGKNRKAPGVSGFNELLSTYRQGAKRRGYEFALTQEAFATLTRLHCFYCGVPPSQISVHKGGVTEAGQQHGAYTYNGIDRLDNTQGYTPDNCVACCHNCNMMKRDATVAEFIERCQRIVCHLK